LYLGGGLVRIEEYCRIDCAAKDGIHLGRNFKLGAYSQLIASGTISDLGIGIRIGDNVGIGEFAYIGGSGGVFIGSDTIVGQYFSVHPENHNFNDRSQLIREQGVTRSGITIGDGCWIGAKVTMTDGAKVGRHCVIAAGSVVTESFPDYSLIGGVPARLIRTIGADIKNTNF
jgi:acetyltransferase-like isoleucine patch superfamily enzyme